MGRPVALTPNMIRFVAAYVAGETATNAARTAGYSPRHASKVGAKLLEHPLVAAEIEKARKKMLAEVNFGAEQAMVELNEKIAAAQAANQFSAVATLMRHKMQLAGLLVEKPAAAAQNFQINIDTSHAPKPVQTINADIFS